jgi:hypothetical protein
MGLSHNKSELLPVKRTVKNHKIFATSNIALLLVVFMVSVCPERRIVYRMVIYAARKYDSYFSIGVITPNLL